MSRSSGEEYATMTAKGVQNQRQQSWASRHLPARRRRRRPHLTTTTLSLILAAASSLLVTPTAYAQTCDNDPQTVVEVSTIQTCAWVALQPFSCLAIDTVLGIQVGEICQRECPTVSGCNPGVCDNDPQLVVNFVSGDGTPTMSTCEQVGRENPGACSLEETSLAPVRVGDVCQKECFFQSGCFPGKCQNNADTGVTFFDDQTFPDTIDCAWVGEYPLACSFAEESLGVQIGLICQKECPAISGCIGGTAPPKPPTAAPTASPTKSPTAVPLLTRAPTVSPSLAPSVSPTGLGSASPSLAPSVSPTGLGSASPSLAPSVAPTGLGSVSPSLAPSVAPTEQASASPSLAPSVSPTVLASASPSLTPTTSPTGKQSETPALTPTTVPPTTTGSSNPTNAPSGGQPDPPTPAGGPSATPPPSNLVPTTMSPTTSSRLPTTSGTPAPSSSSPSLAPSSSRAPIGTPSPSISSSPSFSATDVPTKVPSGNATAPPTTTSVLAPTASPSPADTSDRGFFDTLSGQVEGLMLTMRNVDFLSEDELATMEEILEETFVQYFEDRRCLSEASRRRQRQLQSSSSYSTDITSLTQDVTYDAEDVPTSVFTYDQEISYPFDDDCTPPTGEEATTASVNTNDLTPDEIAALPFDDFNTNAELVLELRDNIDAMQDVSIPLATPVVPESEDGDKDGLSTAGLFAILVAAFFTFALGGAYYVGSKEPASHTEQQQQAAAAAPAEDPATVAATAGSVLALPPTTDYDAPAASAATPTASGSTRVPS